MLTNRRSAQAVKSTKHSLGQQATDTVARAIEPWFKRRAPLTRDISLGLRNVYIFLSREGIFYLLLLVITFIAGVNYGNNLVLGLCFLLGSLLVITIHYTFAHMAGLRIVLLDVGNAQVGDKVRVRLQVSGKGKQPHRQIRFSFARQGFELKQPLSGNPSSTAKVQSHESITISQIREPQIVELWLPAPKRGRLNLPRLTVSSVYPLGILQAWSYVFLDGYAWVYPAALAYDIKAEQLVISDQMHAASLQNQAGQDDFEQLDSYVPGESLARISWGHVARGQGLLSKRFVDPVGQEQVLDYYQMPAANHEDKLRQLRFGIDALAQSQDAFRLKLPDGEGVMGQGYGFVQESLLRLAKTP
jgi:uncharacterized protein (DUF58 family)